MLVSGSWGHSVLQTPALVGLLLIISVLNVSDHSLLLTKIVLTV